MPLRHIATVIRAASPDLAPLLRFAARTGCRQEEAAGLEVRDVDFKRREITFPNSKTKAPRVIAMTAPVERLLRACIPAGAPLDLHVFRPRKGERFRSVPSHWRKVMERSGAPHFRMHDLRHTFAVRWLQAGRSIYPLALHLGHTTVRTTEIYSKWLRVKPL